MPNNLALIGEPSDPVTVTLSLALFMRNPKVVRAASFSDSLHAELQADGITHLILCGLAYTANNAANFPYRVCVLKPKADEAFIDGVYAAKSIPEVLAWYSAATR